MFSEFVGGHARDQRDFPGDVLGIERVQDLDHIIGSSFVGDFNSNRVLDTAHELEMSEPRLPRPFSHPQQMRATVVPPPGRRVFSRHSLLVRQ